MSDYIMAGKSEPERIRRKTSELLIRHHLDWAGLAAGQSFVDFGCASGEVVHTAARVTDGPVLGIDGDAAMLDYAREQSVHLGLPAVRFLQARIAGPGSTDVPDDTFDHAWTRFFLEYQIDPVDCIREMARVLRPGGQATLIDIEGNVAWHYPMTPAMHLQLDEVLADLAVTGFDPFVGGKLATYARAAGLVDVRESVEPYHRIVGRPDAAELDAWRRKIIGIKENYLGRLHPEKAHLRQFFDEFLDWFERDDTMTWSVLYLVQGRKQ